MACAPPAKTDGIRIQDGSNKSLNATRHSLAIRRR
jgi:hypothetical protein